MNGGPHSEVHLHPPVLRAPNGTARLACGLDYRVENQGIFTQQMVYDAFTPLLTKNKK